MQAALGLAIVDESVFALSELKPGLEKIYFTLEKELMEPKYEIHGLKPRAFFWKGRQRRAPAAGRRHAAGVASGRDGFDLRVNTYQRAWKKCKAAAQAR